MIDAQRLEKCLKKVEKPARYIGGELNSVVKEEAALRFCFCFPDVYEVGMSHLGMQILYFAMNETDYACERAFAPWPDMAEAMKNEAIPLYSLETKRPLSEFSICWISGRSPSLQMSAGKKNPSSWPAGPVPRRRSPWRILWTAF